MGGCVGDGGEGAVKVIWREWFNAEAVKKLAAMGTLPRNEFETMRIDYDGEQIAALIARDVYYDSGCELTETIVILEPPSLAGTYDIEIESEPSFIANRRDDGDEP